MVGEPATEADDAPWGFQPEDDKEVRTMTIDGEEVEYRVSDDGVVTYGGDMVFGEGEEGEAALREYLSAPADEDGLVPYGNGLSWRRWPRDTVNYRFKRSCGESCRRVIRGAIAEYEQQTELRFRECDGCLSSVVEIGTDDDGCYSSIGHQFFFHRLNLGPGCVHHSVALHELGHAVGLLHEHQRCDRNDYVRIEHRNVIKGKKHNFKRRCFGTERRSPYDYASVMHYPRWAFSNGEGPTMVPLNDYDGLIAGDSLTYGDRLQIARMYGTALPEAD